MKLVILLLAFCVNSVAAQEESNGLSKPRVLTLDFGDSFFDRVVEQEGTFKQDEAKQSPPKWQYGGFIDLAYPLNFNHPANHLFRSRGTAFHTDSVWLNMAGFYVRKRPSEDTRWGGELTAHGRT